MKPERLIKQTVDTVRTLGEWACYQLRDLETPPPQAANITYYPPEPPDNLERKLVA